MGDLKEEVIAKATGVFGKKPEESISGVKQATEDMGVVEGALNTARKLAGTDGLAEQIKGKDAALEKAGKEKDELKDQLHESQVQLIQKELGGKIDQLSEAIKGGASPKSISEQINEVKKAAESLGLGGSKVSEIREIMGLVTSLSPQQKGLAEQVKDARDLLATLQPEGKKEGLVEGVPASVALEMKRLETNTNLEIEKMKDERQRRDQEFEVTKLKWEEERDLRRQEVDGKIAVERERNSILAGGLEIIGRAAGKAIGEMASGAAAGPGSTIQGEHGAPMKYKVPAVEGAVGDIECPNCKTAVGIGPTTELATCAGCGSQFEVKRVPAEGPVPPGEK
jgi:hypothetical protein